MGTTTWIQGPADPEDITQDRQAEIRTRGIRAKPFLVDALRDNFDDVKAEFAVARRAIEAAWG